MAWHWLKTAWRSLIANPLFSLITIASLSVGCCGALLAGANIRQHLSFDRWVPDADRVLLVRQRDFTGDTMDANVDDGWVYGMYDVAAKLPGVLEQTIVSTTGAMSLGGAPGEEEPSYEGARVLPNYFDFFGIQFIEGNAQTAFARPDRYVITERVARQHFGAPPWIGRTLSLDPRKTDGRTEITIGGVIRDFPAESHRRIDILQELRFEGVYLSRRNSKWGGYTSGGHYLRLAPDVNIEAFQALLKTEIERAAAEAGPSARIGVSSLTLPQIHLADHAESDIDSTGEITMLVTLGSGAAVLLVISAFNFVTLSLARSLKRRREVAIRKVVGADQGAVMRHYLAESFLITAISLIIGFGLAELLHPWFARQLAQPDELFSLYSPVFLGGVVGTGLILALVVGAYPALYLAHVRPRAGLEQGEASNSGIAARLVSGGLLGLQIAMATALLSVALTMAAQSQYVAARPLGYRMANIFAVTPYCPIAGGRFSAGTEAGCDRAFLPTARVTQGVVEATRASANALQSDQPPRSVTRPGQSAELGKAHLIAVETDFLQMMDVTLLAGRLFDGSSAFDRQLLDKRMALNAAESDRVPVVVTRAFLPLIGAATPQDAIGQLVAQINAAPKVHAFEIVGVIEDWHRRSLRYAVESIIFTPGGAQMQIVAKVEPSAESSIRADLRAHAGKPGMPTFMGIRALDESFEASYDGDRRLMTMVASFAALSMVVAGLGVFALSALEIQRRVREIGIRKALGAAPAAVAGIAMGRSLLSASIASVLAWPAAWWVSNSWLNSFVYRTSLGPALLPVASLIVIAFVAVAVAFNTIRAAAIRPGFALRAT